MSNLKTYSTRRIEALTDGMFGIAMTLLVLDINVEAFGALHSSSQLWDSLVGIKGSIYSFVVSFLLLGGMWAVHARQFEFIKRTDQKLITINTVRLLAVVFIPLTTSIAGRYSDLLLGRVLFPINFFLLTAVSYWQWRYATSPEHDFAEGLSEKNKLDLATRSRMIMGMAFLVIFVAAAVGQLAFLVFLLPTILNQMSNRRRQTTTPNNQV